MKVLDQHNINALSKIIYQTNIMPSGKSDSFKKLSKKLILDLQNGYELEKIKRVIEKLGLIFLIVPFCIFVIYESSPMILRSWDMLEGSSEPGGLPFTYLLKTSIYIFALLILLQALKRLIEIK